jgi:hypothetical protein
VTESREKLANLLLARDRPTAVLSADIFLKMNPNAIGHCGARSGALRVLKPSGRAAEMQAGWY